MEPLSPRSTNIPPKPKSEQMKSKKSPETGKPPAPREKSHAPKDYAPEPPSIIKEPGRNGETYIRGEFLGKGGFAVCYEGSLMRNGRVLAMKVVKSEMQQKKMQEKFRTELQIHSKMRHPNIVAFHRAFTFEKNTYVILELCSNGSVMDMVKKRKCLSLPEVRRFMVQLCGAVKYLHKRHVAHRDLKMGNMFLDHNMNVKVGDFGLAAIILSEKDEKRRRTLCGTPNYIAPEVLDKSKGGHNQKVDIWSIGVICFAMLAGYPPFQSSTQEEIYKKVKNLTYAWPKEKESGNHIPDEAKSLVSQCLSLEENERPEPDDIVDHPFFNMYPGCIPRQLEPECRHTRPEWILRQEPRGDCMAAGSSLDFDPKYASVASKFNDWEERYEACKNEFYTECGVGRTPSGVPRKPAGKRCSKTAWAECAAEEALGLQPVMPLPHDRVYCYHVVSNKDWSAPEADVGNESHSSTGDEEEQDNKIASQVQAVRAARSHQVLAAQLRRKDLQPKSHAALLRQPAQATRQFSRDMTIRSVQSSQDMDRLPRIEEPAAIPATNNLLGERPIRTRTRVISAYQGSLREKPMQPAPSVPKSESMPAEMTRVKTRAQSRQQLVTQTREPASPVRRRRDDLDAVKPSGSDNDGIASVTRSFRIMKIDARDKERPRAEEEMVMKPRVPLSMQQSRTETQQAHKKEDVKHSRSASHKSRSTLGLGPLIHPEETAELMPGSSVGEVMANLRTYLSELRQRPSSEGQSRTRRRQQQAQTQSAEFRAPHSYVVKWVDYTNRYGIGYVLDDGSVGCIFNAENGSPASCVVVRDGERHIRRKARAREHPDGPKVYSECGQLVPRKGRPVEFYENVELDPGLRQGGGVRRVLVPAAMFEVRHSSASGEVDGKVRKTAGVPGLKCETEKVKRVRLVDQFGKYMIGSLGRGDNEDDLSDMASDDNDGKCIPGPYVKFYQRLGNVGIWGFGDGAFQFNFPDHTKIVISLCKSQSSSSSCQIDFYHLSPSAARYLSSKGKMHPNGFDTRTGISEDASVFLSALSGNTECPPVCGISSSRFRDILEANSFREKVDFIEDVLTSWIRNGRLGGRITSAFSKYASRTSSNSSISSTSASMATLRSNTTGSLSSASSTAALTSVAGSAPSRSVSPCNDAELFWDGPQERTWEGASGGKFVWVSVGAQGGDSEYMSVVLKGASGVGEVQCGGVEAQDALKERLKALVS
ncbi:hypothetical protein VTO42DRAFT_4885 [Malbranchea cinnamomea]